MCVSSQGSSRPAPAPAPAPMTASAQDSHAKLDADLDAVMEKVRLCREMLPESPGIQQDEVLRVFIQRGDGLLK